MPACLYVVCLSVLQSHQFGERLVTSGFVDDVGRATIVCSCVLSLSVRMSCSVIVLSL